MKKSYVDKYLLKKVTVVLEGGDEIVGTLTKGDGSNLNFYYCVGKREDIYFRPSTIKTIRVSDFRGDLISRKRVKYELGNSTMPRRYRDFCLRVLDNESLIPTIEVDK